MWRWIHIRLKHVKRTLFSNEVIGEIKPANEWTSERLEWIEENKDKKRKMHPNNGYEVLQGSGVVQGRLIGGCIEVLEFAKGTTLWPERTIGKIVFYSSKHRKKCQNLHIRILVTKLWCTRNSTKSKRNYFWKASRRKVL